MLGQAHNIFVDTGPLAPSFNDQQQPLLVILPD